MWYLPVFLSVFLVFDIAEFAERDTTESNEVCKKVDPGSEYPKLSPFEEKLKYLENKKNFVTDKFQNNTLLSIDKFPELQTARLIPPGLKWCGDGDRAKGLEDLGYFKDTDACCRSHDFCKNNIFAGEDLKNLKNNGLFTRSATSCDTEFYKCLKYTNSIVSNRVGKVYFNMMRPQSFSCICPAADCDAKDDNECMDHCDKYAWVDNPKF